MHRFKTMLDLAHKKDMVGLRRAIGNRLCYSKIARILPDTSYLKLIYQLQMGRKLNLSNPQTFNEKLQWLKIYNRRPEYHQMVDKQASKQYVSSIIGNEFIIPTLGVWDKFDEIPFETLPNQFVLKCTHDSGSTIICKDKRTFDYEKAKARINRGLKTDLFWFGREWPYKDVPRKIIAEKFMIDNEVNELRDYKFFCFRGEVKCFKVDFDRFIDHRANYFDPDGNPMPFGEVVCPPKPDKQLVLPENLDEMISLAEKLSGDIPFLRVDFYNVQGRIYFGELTFSPASGMGKFIPEAWDAILGSWLRL